MSNVMYAGEVRTIDVQVLDVDGVTPFDLTSKQLLWMAKINAGAGDSDPATIVKSSTSGGIVIDPDQSGHKGQATIGLDSVDTQGKPGTYTMGLKVFPGAIEADEDTLSVRPPVIQSTVEL